MMTTRINQNNPERSSHVDFSKYRPLKNTGTTHHRLFHINMDDIDKLKHVGIDLKKRSKTGTFILYDNHILTTSSMNEGVEILPLPEAIKLYPWIKEKYFFNAMDKNRDEFTRQVDDGTPGYFIWIKKNTKLEKPLHAGLLMHTPGSSMLVHNIVVVDEGAHLHLITGCTSGSQNKSGLHIAVSEHYVGENATFINTMIHNWGADFVVRPRSSSIVDANAMYISNYYSITPPKDIESIPYTNLRGENSSAKYMTVLTCMPDTFCDIGGTVLLSGENSSAELVARAVNYGGTVIQTGLLIGAAKGARGHVDCSGMMLSDKGIIEAVPGLRSTHPDARMSHEAAIGKIDKGEVNYLQSKGLEEMQAVSLIIRGFLNIDIEDEGLEEDLGRTIQQIASLSGHGE
ncbi:MAG: SufD family Fe-S cluster assembly protein [Sphingobacteriia bacterium]|nr:SufD family Fe-S cluster assembly protein [Sphingobacteriia bacterium]